MVLQRLRVSPAKKNMNPEKLKLFIFLHIPHQHQYKYADGVDGFIPVS